MAKSKPKLLLWTLICLALLAGLFALRTVYDRLFYEGRPAPDLRPALYRSVIAKTSLPIPGEPTIASISPHRLLTSPEQIRGLCELINAHSRRLTVRGPHRGYGVELFYLALEREDGWTKLTLYQESDRIVAERYDRQTERSEYWVTDLQLAYDVADYLACGENPFVTDLQNWEVTALKKYLAGQPSTDYLSAAAETYENDQALNEAIEELLQQPYDQATQAKYLRIKETRAHYLLNLLWSTERSASRLVIRYFPDDALLTVMPGSVTERYEEPCFCLDLTDRNLKIVEYLEALETAGAFDEG